MLRTLLIAALLLPVTLLAAEAGTGLKNQLANHPSPFELRLSGPGGRSYTLDRRRQVEQLLDRGQIAPATALAVDEIDGSFEAGTGLKNQLANHPSSFELRLSGPAGQSYTLVHRRQVEQLLDRGQIAPAASLEVDKIDRSFEAGAGLKNQLANHPSPYLALHGNDPVNWQAWGPEVLERAKKEGKLLYISSGYFSCHWCHVMQRESYQNPEIAALLNNHFIPIKVDRELLPALDAHLIEFVTHTRGSAGWPLNVFLTPDGYPLAGLTYSPPSGFKQILNEVQGAWREDAPRLQQMAMSASEELQDTAQPFLPGKIDTRKMELRLRETAFTLGDEMEGGFGRQSRFPMAPQWSVLLDSLARSPDPRLKELVELTLDQMARRGMRDHIGGGFFRYTVDPGWQTPHFEKMLYTQAQLSQLYLKAASVLDRPDYLEVVRDTLDFSLRVMRDDRGAFIASLSAVDPQDVEGGGYLWSDSELQRVLNDGERAFFRSRWGMTGSFDLGAEFLPQDGSSLASIAKEHGRPLTDFQALESQVRKKLLEARAPRNHPKDDKLLAAWNGLMLSALVDAARQLNEPRYRRAAKELRDYLVNKLWDGVQLYRAHDGERPQGEAALEDYAHVATGLYAWSQLSGEDGDRALAAQLMSTAWQRFYINGGWQATDKLLLPGVARSSAITDGHLPSPAAILIDLAFQIGDEGERVQAAEALDYSYTEAAEQPVWYSTHLAVLITHKGRE
ncbi:MAG: thioredoxin domain-containing protein [Gammaproteobacteria bacterium]|nr:thioredoxin domain-containing protein [Gammaproteobacteria bacterium]